MIKDPIILPVFVPQIAPTQQWPQRLEQLSEDQLIALGFENILTFTGLPRETVIKNRCREMIERQPLSKRPRTIFRNSEPCEERCEVWAHPAGILASQVFERHRFSDGTSHMWSIKSSHMDALYHQSLIPRHEKAMHGAHRLASGRSVNKMHSTFGSDFQKDWKWFSKHSQSGNMLSFSQWKDCLTDATIHPLYDRSLTSLSLERWVEIALPWNSLVLPIRTTQSPSDIMKLGHLSTRRYKQELSKAIGEKTSILSQDVAPLIKLMLNRLIIKDMPRSISQQQQVDRTYRISYHAEQFTNVIYDRLENVITAPTILTDSQSDVVKGWVQELINPSRASASRFNQLPMNLPQLDGFSKLDIAFDCVGSPGIHTKLRECISRTSNDQLMAWCQGEGVARPLALTIASAMLKTENRAYSAEELEGTKLFGQEILSTIIDRLGPGALVWDDALGNVWGAAVGQRFNLPTDQDLVEIQIQRTSDFFQWAESQGIALPQTIRWSPDIDPPAGTLQVYEANLLEPSEFVADWQLHARSMCQAYPMLYWHLLSPVSCLMQRNALSEIAKNTSSIPRIAPRPSL